MKLKLYISLLLISLKIFPQSQETLTIADSMPVFPGGNNGLAKFLATNMNIPPIVRESSKHEKAFVKFVVDTMGKAQAPVIIQPSHFKEFDEEALRLVSIMPLWKPGQDKNRKVMVLMTLPISYKDLGTVKKER